MKRPVYKLTKGQAFKYTDERWWVVDEIILPNPDSRQVNAEILAHNGQSNRRFFLHHCKIVEVKE